LRTRAGSALLQADTTMSHAKQELDFARAQYSDQQVAEFAQEIARAEDLMRKSFQRQQLLTDSIPDTEAEQRAWLTEIIDNSQEVTRIAQEQDAKLAQLRNLEQEAPQAIEALAQRLPQLRASVEEIAAQYRALKERYLPSALEPISKTPTLLESNMVLCAAEVEKAQATALCEKVVSEMKTRVSARIHKETQRRKTALESSSMPTKLVDCRSTNVEHSELFIVEGDSALGTARLARSSSYQALLPIRGKILNTQRASVTDVLANAECAALIQVIGAGSGRTFDLDSARYGKVIMMTDADVDGAHIRTLLLTLFYRYMRPLIEAGRVYAAVPPLHRVEVVRRGKPNEMVYTYSEKQLHELLDSLREQGVSYKEPIQRYKGLGEMDADQLAETTMDPRHRMLRRIRIEDAEAAERAFSLLMGSEVAPRKEFIIAGAHQLDAESIDM